jgi:peptidoglycan/xylan/chitin deacetylase (PgdA/CDA1 family)
MGQFTTDSYYTLRPFIPRRLQILARRLRVRSLRQRYAHRWPIWESAGTPPPGFPGWPQGKRFALVLTHDVESPAGVSQCERLAKLEEERGFRSAFAFVPLRYDTPERLRRELAARGFEILVHGLYHDGKDFRDRPTFEKRLGPVNEFLKAWETRGFSSPSMLHNLPWVTELNVDYAISTYDTDPFEPQSCQLGRIFPFSVQPPSRERNGFIELPYTLSQDFTLLVLMREPTTAIWRRKLDWIAEKGGMALLNTHPDYMSFDNAGRRFDRYPVELYTGFLDYIRQRYGSEVWIARPSEIARYWRELQPLNTPSTIVPHPELCETCRQAHAEGWVQHYPSITPETNKYSLSRQPNKISISTASPLPVFPYGQKKEVIE